MANNTVWLDLPASYKYLSILSISIAEILAHCGNEPPSHTTVYNVQLAAQEACANIVGHAYHGLEPGRINVSLTLAEGPQRLIIEMTDTGHAFDPSEVPLPNLDQVQEGGYGLFLIRSLMDEVAYEFQPGRNRLKLVKHLG